MPSTLSDLRDELTSFAGLDLTPTEATTLLNRKHRELCTRSGWTRANVTIGPTVAGQAAYTMPDRLYRPLKVFVNELPYTPADEEEVKLLIDRDLRLRAFGNWWLSFDNSDVEKLSIYPTPGEAGLPITALSVVYPDDLTADSDVVKIPEEYCEGLVDGAAGIAYSRLEDNQGSADELAQNFDTAIVRLRGHRLARVGKGPVQAKILGWHR